jgi:hypothetical protein
MITLSMGSCIWGVGPAALRGGIVFLSPMAVGTPQQN